MKHKPFLLPTLLVLAIGCVVSKPTTKHSIESKLIFDSFTMQDTILVHFKTTQLQGCQGIINKEYITLGIRDSASLATFLLQDTMYTVDLNENILPKLKTFERQLAEQNPCEPSGYGANAHTMIIFNENRKVEYPYCQREFDAWSKLCRLIEQ